MQFSEFTVAMSDTPSVLTNSHLNNINLKTTENNIQIKLVQKTLATADARSAAVS